MKPHFYLNLWDRIFLQKKNNMRIVTTPESKDYNEHKDCNDLEHIAGRVKRSVILGGTNISMEPRSDMWMLTNILSHALHKMYEELDKVNMSQKEYDSLIDAIRDIENVPTKFIATRVSLKRVKEAQVKEV